MRRSKAKLSLAFYRRSKEINQFLHSNSSISRTNYLRILLIASIDTLLTLPISIINISLTIKGETQSQFYPGWSHDHKDWAPISFTYAELTARRKIGWAAIFLEVPLHCVSMEKHRWGVNGKLTTVRQLG